MAETWVYPYMAVPQTSFDDVDFWEFLFPSYTFSQSCTHTDVPSQKPYRLLIITLFSEHLKQATHSQATLCFGIFQMLVFPTGHEGATSGTPKPGKATRICVREKQQEVKDTRMPIFMDRSINRLPIWRIHCGWLGLENLRSGHCNYPFIFGTCNHVTGSSLG